MKKLKNKKFLAIAVIATFAMVTATACGSSDDQIDASTSTPSIVTPDATPDIMPEVTPEVTPDVDDSPAIGEMSPTGARKYFNYNNMRYAFVQDGEEMDIASDKLGDMLGELFLMDGVTLDDNGIAQFDGTEAEYKEFASTFADGGSVYKLNDYHDTHRIAVEKDGKYYIAENVGNYDNSAVNFGDILDNWDLTSKVVRAEIFDHMGNKMLRELPQDEAIVILEKLATGTHRQDMENADYEEIASAQSSGLSYQVRFVFEDGTYTTSHIIPSMDNFSFGDVYGNAENLGSDLERMFANLTQDDAPMASPMG